MKKESIKKIFIIGIIIFFIIYSSFLYLKKVDKYCESTCELSSNSSQNILNRIKGEWILTDKVYLISRVQDSELYNSKHLTKNEYKELQNFKSNFSGDDNIFKVVDGHIEYNDKVIEIEKMVYYAHGGQFNLSNQVHVDTSGNSFSFDSEIVTIYLNTPEIGDYIDDIGIIYYDFSKVIVYMHPNKSTYYYMVECRRK